MRIGIDEVGRGPLAGPVCVGAFGVPEGFDYSLLAGVRDSKKLSPKQRAEWDKKIRALEEQGVRFSVACVSASTIDIEGIAPAIRTALAEALASLDCAPEEAEVLLDGGLFAPKEYTHQKTIIKGDATEPLISSASIIAKEHRDALLTALDAKYPEYGFAVHKGYGTLAHRQATQRHGLCPEHRKTFCKNIPISLNVS